MWRCTFGHKMAQFLNSLVIVAGRLYRTRGGWGPCIRRPTPGWTWRCTLSTRTASRTWTSASWRTSARPSPSSPSWPRCAGKLTHIVMLAVSFQVLGASQRGRRRHPHPGKFVLHHIISFQSLVHSRIEYMAHLSEVFPASPFWQRSAGNFLVKDAFCNPWCEGFSSNGVSM